jgi:hypothetical protein
MQGSGRNRFFVKSSNTWISATDSWILLHVHLYSRRVGRYLALRTEPAGYIGMICSQTSPSAAVGCQRPFVVVWTSTGRGDYQVSRCGLSTFQGFIYVTSCCGIVKNALRYDCRNAYRYHGTSNVTVVVRTDNEDVVIVSDQGEVLRGVKLTNLVILVYHCGSQIQRPLSAKGSQ